MKFLLDTPGDRLNAVITWASKVAKICYNQKDLATKLGYNPCYFSALKSNLYEMNDGFLQELKKFEPRINTDWIITGNGEMLVDGITEIPTQIITGENFVTLEKQQLWRAPTIERVHLWIKITNLSMTPRFFVNDILACRKNGAPKTGNIFLPLTNKKSFVARLAMITENTYTFSFDNAERFPRVELEKQNIQEFYQIIGLIRTEL